MSIRALNTPAIDCVDIDFCVGKKTILNNISFSVQPGEIAGLLGPNGAGKSTLLRIIGGLAPPKRGHVELFGERAGVATLADTALLPDRGKLPPWLTCAEWIGYAERLYPDWDNHRADELIETLEIKLDTRILFLSRGEEARLQLMTCLARKARIVLLDEPFAGVDLVSRQRIANSVVKELAENHRGFLIATHDILEMENLFDRVLLIGNGELKGNRLVEDLRETGSSVEKYYREEFK